MAFKMRSGNKVSFKNMGSSPTKQTDATADALAEGLGTGGLGSEVQGTLTEAQLLERRRKIEHELHKKEEKDFDYKEKKEEIEDLSKDPSMSEMSTEEYIGSGEVEIGDDDVNQYKTKEQIKQDAKTRKAKSKANTETEARKFLGMKIGTKQYTKAEKAADKKAKLEDQLQRSKGTGEHKFTYNIGKALLADDFGSGIEYKPKEELIQKKLYKTAKKASDKAAKKKGKTDRKDLKKKNSKPGTVASRWIARKIFDMMIDKKKQKEIKEKIDAINRNKKK